MPTYLQSDTCNITYETKSVLKLGLDGCKEECETSLSGYQSCRRRMFKATSKTRKKGLI